MVNLKSEKKNVQDLDGSYTFIQSEHRCNIKRNIPIPISTYPAEILLLNGIIMHTFRLSVLIVQSLYCLLCCFFVNTMSKFFNMTTYLHDHKCHSSEIVSLSIQCQNSSTWQLIYMIINAIVVGFFKVKCLLYLHVINLKPIKWKPICTYMYVCMYK
jgi:hypothetical protein